MNLWCLGSGIIHQIILENYAFPGGLMIGLKKYIDVLIWFKIDILLVEWMNKRWYNLDEF